MRRMMILAESTARMRLKMTPILKLDCPLRYCIPVGPINDPFFWACRPTGLSAFRIAGPLGEHFCCFYLRVFFATAKLCDGPQKRLLGFKCMWNLLSISFILTWEWQGMPCSSSSSVVVERICIALENRFYRTLGEHLERP